MQFTDCCSALISSTHHGSGACQAEGAGAPVTVLGARGVEEGTQQAEDLYPEGGRGPAACVGAVVEGSCCSPVADSLAASWVAGNLKEEVEGQEEVLQAADKHGGDMVVLEARSWAAWEHRRDLLSSSSTAGSGSLRQTCRSCLWT